jgi:sugar-specific transcriptional regulator TrmB
MAKSSSAAETAVLNELKTLGFTDYESRAYIALVKHPSSTAYEVSQRSGVPRPNTYSALKSLEDRGAVMPVSERPSRYTARPPDQLFRTIAAQTSQLCSDVSAHLNALAGASQEQQYVWMLSGESSVHAKVAEMIAAAEEEIWFKADPSVLDIHVDALKAATKKKGVRLMIILFGDDPSAYQFNDRCEIYVHEASGVRMGTADNYFTIAIDHREMLTANNDGELEAAHSESGPVVKMALSLIRHDYYMAEIFKLFKKQLDKKFGPHLSALRTRSYTPEQVDSFKSKTGL